MAVLFASYFLTALLSHGGLGAGDVRAAGPIGLALAWLSWSTLLAGTLLSLLCFAAMATASKNTTNSAPPQELPFGPAMFSGTFFAILL
jgi:leader peptidase (prepilin peptidase) / N-methyltransferase